MRRAALRDALISSLDQLIPNRTPISNQRVTQNVTQEAPPTEPIRQESADLHAARPGKKPSKISEAQITRIIDAVRETATADAADVARYLDNLVQHLDIIGCSPDEVPVYLRMRNQTLASLYFLLMKGPRPSPMELRSLALRFALDARKPIVVDVRQCVIQLTPKGIQISAYKSPVGQLLNFPQAAAVVRDPLAVRVLQHAFAEPPHVDQLISAIEGHFGGPPKQSDTLCTDNTAFTFEIIDGTSTKPRVQLWIDDREVSFPISSAIHKLLRELCRNPQMELSGPDAKDLFQITNLSKTAGEIRKALELTRAGAGCWLQTNRVRWADGHAPRPRSKKPARENGNNKK